MRKVTIKLFKFEELSDEVKKVLIANEIENDYPEDNWHEAILEDEKERLIENGFELPEIKYRGFYSQGDGASFTAEDIDLLVFFEKNKELILDESIYEIITLIKNKELELNFSLERNNSKYYHPYSIMVSSHIDFCIDRNVGVLAKRELPSLENIIRNFIIEKSNLIYKRLQKEYDALHEDEAVENYIISKDLEYYEEGGVYGGVV